MAQAGKAQIVGGMLLSAAVFWMSLKMFPHPPGWLSLHWLKTLVLFPSIVFFLGAAQHLKPDLGQTLGFAGDLSYSSYLIHVPIQMATMLSFHALGIDLEPTSYLFWGYLIVVFGLAYLTFILFERPAQAFIRRVIDVRKKSADLTLSKIQK